MLSRVCSVALRGSQYHTLSALLKNVVVPVPQMGESIKEGIERLQTLHCHRNPRRLGEEGRRPRQGR